MVLPPVRSKLELWRGAAVVVGLAFAVVGCTQEQSDAVADDIARVLLYFILFALVVALLVVALVALAGGMIAKGLHGLRNPPAAPTLPGQPPPQPPDRSTAWGTLIAGTVLAALVLPIAVQVFDYSISSALISAVPVALVVGAVVLIRRGPPRAAPPAAPPAAFGYPPPPPPPPPPLAPTPPPTAPPRRRAPLRAPGRESGTDPPRRRN